MEIASLIIGIISLGLTIAALVYAVVINGQTKENLKQIKTLGNKNVELTKQLHKIYQISIMQTRLDERKNAKK